MIVDVCERFNPHRIAIRALRKELRRSGVFENPLMKTLCMGSILLLFLACIALPSHTFGAQDENRITALRELIEKYDSSGCRECHQDIYDQWQGSHHARSLMGLNGWVFMSKYLKEGVLATPNPAKATKANFPCAKCHLPQLFEASDAVAAELAEAIVRDDKETISQLNIGCLVCHNSKAVIHSHPEKGVLYGSSDLGEHTEDYPAIKKSPFMKSPLFCGQCHGLGPNLEFETPVQCATLYGSYLHAYIPSGGSQSCQDCHMPERNHACPPDFNNREETSARLKAALPMEVRFLNYTFHPKEGELIPMVVVETRITNKAGHRIPDG